MAFACLEITSVPNILAVCTDVSSLLFPFMSCFCEKEENFPVMSLMPDTEQNASGPRCLPTSCHPRNVLSTSVVVFAQPVHFVKLLMPALRLLVSFLSKSPSSYDFICSADQSKRIHFPSFVLSFSLLIGSNHVCHPPIFRED